MLGKTNACVGGSGGGSGETIEVLNKTGAVINQGDKVWLNKEVREAGSSYNLGWLSSGRTPPVISHSGNFVFYSGSLYSVDSTPTATQIGTFSASVNSVKYGPNSSIFGINTSSSSYSSYRIDEINRYTIKGYIYIGENWFLNSTEAARFDIDTGSLIESYTDSFSGVLSSIAIDDKIYSLYNSGGSYVKRVFDGSSWVSSSVITNDTTSLYPIGVTKDKKYIIAITASNTFSSASGGYLRIIEVIDEDNVKVLTVGEIPDDLKPSYLSSSRVTFNPYNGVLTSNADNKISIMKYENGSWSKISLSLDFDVTNLQAVTVSEDLSRITFTGKLSTSSSSDLHSYIVNLTNLDGYSAIKYNPYVLNENTITATALAESQPNELTQVQIGSVTNEDLTVTENGTYTPSATYTGFGSVNVNVKGAEKIEAVNKTGSSIAKGDKVWVNENYKGEVSSYQLWGASNSIGGCIDRTGTFGVSGNKGYNIGDTEATYAYDVAGGNPKILVYGDDNSILTCAGNGNFLYRIDGEAQFTLNPGSVGSLCSKYLYHGSGGSGYLKELNMTTGETIKRWPSSKNVSSAVVIDNTVYAFSSKDNNYYVDLPEESESTISLNARTSVANNTGTYRLPLGITSDNKYIVMANGSMGETSLSGVTFFEILGKGQLKELSSGELPTDLQPFYSVSCHVAFNPYTGVLTAFSTSVGYVIMKYEKGTWSKLPIEVNIPGGSQAPITLPDDLSKACTVYYLSSYYYSEIYNLPTTEGYGAIAYNTRNITENTITGYAMTDAEPNETVTVSVPAEV